MFNSNSDTDIELSLELLGSLDGTREGENLTTAELFTLDATKESTHVITSFCLH
jgi:hypothetical protein